ncbi:MAG: bacteriohemerythrin [Melioribacteraceae bacterium]|nr:bacteriohemerythrin [Melioribacteraceae bacterium]
MDLIEWDDSYSVNVYLIDRQHQRIFEYANEYQKAVQNGKSESALRKLLDGLVEYAAVHFSTEERYFIQFNYKETEEHKREHKILTAKILDLSSKSRVGVSVEEDEVSNFLKIWLDAHIKGTDHKYIECFNQGGLR